MGSHVFLCYLSIIICLLIRCGFSAPFSGSFREGKHKEYQSDDFTCPNRQDGLYPNPDDCSTFYQCSNGYAYLLDCPQDLYFDPETETCDFPWNVNCPPTTTIRSTEFTDSTEPNGTTSMEEKTTAEPQLTTDYFTDDPTTEPETDYTTERDVPTTDDSTTDELTTDYFTDDPITTEPVTDITTERDVLSDESI